MKHCKYLSEREIDKLKILARFILSRVPYTTYTWLRDNKERVIGMTFSFRHYSPKLGGFDQKAIERTDLIDKDDIRHTVFDLRRDMLGKFPLETQAYIEHLPILTLTSDQEKDLRPSEARIIARQAVQNARREAKLR